jgi:hypothetical protein
MLLGSKKSVVFNNVSPIFNFPMSIVNVSYDLYLLALPLQPPKSHVLEQSNWIRAVRRRLLNHIPMLHHTRPIKPPHIHKRKRLFSGQPKPPMDYSIRTIQQDLQNRHINTRKAMPGLQNLGKAGIATVRTLFGLCRV